MRSSTLTTKGQVTVPAPIREALGLKAGDRLWFRLRDGVIEVDTRSYAERTAGVFAGRVPPPDDLQARIKEEERTAAKYAAAAATKQHNRGG